MQTVQEERLSSPLETAVLPPVQPDGSLLWWIFRDAATPLPKLARAALRVGFPTLFLPLPFPIAPQVAFRRALNRATAKVAPGWGRWRADIAPPAAVPEELVTWSRSFKPHAVLGVVQVWEPREDEDLWRARLWLGMRCDPKAAAMDAAEILRVFQDTDEGPVEITDQATVPGSVTSPVNLAMANRVYRTIRHERSHAMAPEISDGVIEALENVSGVRLRPGLCALPGAEGVKRARVTAAYLKQVGLHTGCGIYDLYHLPTAITRGGGLVEAGLELQIQALKSDLDRFQPEESGIAALRTQADLARALERRIDANATLLGPATTRTLHRRLQEAQRRIAAIQKQMQQLLKRKVELERKPTTPEVQSLRDGLAQLHVAARKRDAEALQEVRTKLAAGQGAALAGGFAPLLRRLRRLVEATEHVHRSKEEALPLFKALASAATFIEERAQEVLRIPPQPTSRPRRRPSMRKH